MTEPKRAPQVLRRDFLFGAAAGASAVGAGWLASYNPWAAHEHATESYSQCGEDLIAAQILAFLKVDKPSYLDIGAFMPVKSNNTYLFYRAGGRGVLVEPNVDLTAELRRMRPDDQTLAIGIGFSDRRETLDYYRMSLPQWNTFDKEEAERRVQETNGQVKIEEVVKTPLVPVNDVIAEHLGGRAPDFLSVDVEGLDLSILKTLDFDRFRPKVICAETLVALSHRMDPGLGEYLKSKGYLARGITFPNTLFVDEKLFS